MLLIDAITAARGELRVSRACKLCTVMIHTNRLKVLIYIDAVFQGWRNFSMVVQLRLREHTWIRKLFVWDVQPDVWVFPSWIFLAVETLTTLKYHTGFYFISTWTFFSCAKLWNWHFVLWVQSLLFKKNTNYKYFLAIVNDLMSLGNSLVRYFINPQIKKVFYSCMCLKTLMTFLQLSFFLNCFVSSLLCCQQIDSCQMTDDIDLIINLLTLGRSRSAVIGLTIAQFHNNNASVWLSNSSLECREPVYLQTL